LCRSQRCEASEQRNKQRQSICFHMHGALRKIALDFQDNLPPVRTAAAGSKKALNFSIMSSGSQIKLALSLSPIREHQNLPLTPCLPPGV
jgi:hypothetical protein